MAIQQDEQHDLLQQRIEQLERDIATLRTQRKWQWRVMIGTVVALLLQLWFITIWIYRALP